MKQEHIDKIKEALSNSWIQFEDGDKIRIQQIISLCDKLQMDYDLCNKKQGEKYLKWVKFYKEYPQKCITQVFVNKTFEEVRATISDIVRPSSMDEMLELIKDDYNFVLSFDDKENPSLDHILDRLKYEEIDFTPICPNQLLINYCSLWEFTFELHINDLKEKENDKGSV